MRMKPNYLPKARIAYVLDVSTCHITKKDTELLDETDAMINPLVVYKYDEGYFVLMPHPKANKGWRKELEGFWYSNEFINLVSICVERKYKYMRLDCDGEVYPSLPKFDW